MKDNVFQQAMKLLIEQKGSQFASEVFTDIMEHMKMALLFCILVDKNQDQLIENIKQFLITCNYNTQSIDEFIKMLKETTQKIMTSKSNVVHDNNNKWLQ